MTKDEALKLALEALEVANSCVDGYYIPKGKTQLPEVESAITAIREALAQPEQEPVAWITKNGKGWLRWHRPEDNEKNKDSIPLYTTPPHRKPLTDDEIDKLPWEPHEGNPMTFAEGLRYFARAIEAAHGIKE